MPASALFLPTLLRVVLNLPPFFLFRPCLRDDAWFAWIWRKQSTTGTVPIRLQPPLITHDSVHFFVICIEILNRRYGFGSWSRLRTTSRVETYVLGALNKVYASCCVVSLTDSHCFKQPRHRFLLLLISKHTLLLFAGATKAISPLPKTTNSILKPMSRLIKGFFERSQLALHFAA
jgi:hypothetical protein